MLAGAPNVERGTAASVNASGRCGSDTAPSIVVQTEVPFSKEGNRSSNSSFAIRYTANRGTKASSSVRRHHSSSRTSGLSGLDCSSPIALGTWHYSIWRSIASCERATWSSCGFEMSRMAIESLHERSSCSRKPNVLFNLKSPSRRATRWLRGSDQRTSNLRIFCFPAECTNRRTYPHGNMHALSIDGFMTSDWTRAPMVRIPCGGRRRP